MKIHNLDPLSILISHRTNKNLTLIQKCYVLIKTIVGKLLTWQL